MMFPRKQCPENASPSPEYLRGYAACETAFCRRLEDLAAYIYLLERQVHMLQQQLSQRDRH